MLTRPGTEALERLKGSLQKFHQDCRYVVFMVAMVEGSPLYITLQNEAKSVLESFDVEHPRWWGKAEIEGEEFENMQIVFQSLRVFLGEMMRIGIEIPNDSTMYGWTYKIA